MDAQFQYWLSVSFAVLVAAFIAGERLTFRWRAWVAFLYLLVSVLFALRFAGAAMHATEMTEELVRRGVPTPNDLATIAGLLRSSIFVLGFFTTMLFLFIRFPKDNPLGRGPEQ